MSKIIITSFRLPYELKEENGERKVRRSISGLVTGIEDLRERTDTIWIGWEGVDTKTYKQYEEQFIEARKDRFINVEVSSYLIEKAYNGFINQELWSIFHGFINYSRFIQEEWEAFIKLNELFADKIVDNYNDGDIVYIQDFQLMLVPEMLKEKVPNIKVGFFLHIPFPSAGIFKLIPVYKNLVRSLSKTDYIGFHTETFANNYRDLCLEEEINTDAIDVNPIGINFDKLKVNKEKALNIRNSIGTPIILGCERADFAKGILERLSAYELLLKNNKDIRENVTLVQLAVGSRKGSQSYQEIGQAIDCLVADINGKYGTLSWTPIRYLTYGLDKETLFSLYSISDICSVNSLADGLNLVSFEYCGVESMIDNRSLILSQFAGASDILTDAHIVNPRDIDNLANTFYDVLKNPNNAMIQLREKVKNHRIEDWTDKFLNKIN